MRNGGVYAPLFLGNLPLAHGNAGVGAKMAVSRLLRSDGKCGRRLNRGDRSSPFRNDVGLSEAGVAHALDDSLRRIGVSNCAAVVDREQREDKPCVAALIIANRAAKDFVDARLFRKPVAGVALDSVFVCGYPEKPKCRKGMG